MEMILVTMMTITATNKSNDNKNSNNRYQWKMLIIIHNQNCYKQEGKSVEQFFGREFVILSKVSISALTLKGETESFPTRKDQVMNAYRAKEGDGKQKNLIHFGTIYFHELPLNASYGDLNLSRVVTFESKGWIGSL